MYIKQSCDFNFGQNSDIPITEAMLKLIQNYVFFSKYNNNAINLL